MSGEDTSSTDSMQLLHPHIMGSMPFHFYWTTLYWYSRTPMLVQLLIFTFLFCNQMTKGSKWSHLAWSMHSPALPHFYYSFFFFLGGGGGVGESGECRFFFFKKQTTKKSNKHYQTVFDDYYSFMSFYLTVNCTNRYNAWYLEDNLLYNFLFFLYYCH